MKGYIDSVTPEGVVEGWCWDESAPAQRVAVSIHIDGKEVARTVACNFRQDLRLADVRDGYQSFRVVLPGSVLSQRRSQTITMVNAATGERFGSPYKARFRPAMALDDRLSELEARNRLLEGRIAELADSTKQTQAPAELFAVVGAFFQRLSQDLARGVPLSPEHRLAEALQATRKSRAPITFPVAANPALSILVQAECPLEQLYACLAAVRRASAGIDIHVTVLDTGAFDETALVCSFVRGIRYIRTAADLVSEWSEAAAGEISPFTLFLSGYAIIGEEFLTEIREEFESTDNVGAVGGRAAGLNGAQHGGLLLENGQLLDGAGAGLAYRGTDSGGAAPVHALAHHAVAFRRAAVAALGGLDPVFGNDIGAAAIDLCFRMRAAGWSVHYQPRATLSLARNAPEPWISAALSTPSRSRDLLSQRWLRQKETADLARLPDRAVVLGQADQARDEVEAVTRLHQAGYVVFYLPAGAGTSAEHEAELRRAGAYVAPRGLRPADLAPRIAFAASKRAGVGPLLASAGKDIQCVVGLRQLEQVLPTAGRPASAA